MVVVLGCSLKIYTIVTADSFNENSIENLVVIEEKLERETNKFNELNFEIDTCKNNINIIVQKIEICKQTIVEKEELLNSEDNDEERINLEIDTLRNELTILESELNVEEDKLFYKSLELSDIENNINILSDTINKMNELALGNSYSITIEDGVMDLLLDYESGYSVSISSVVSDKPYPVSPLNGYLGIKSVYNNEKIVAGQLNINQRINICNSDGSIAFSYDILDQWYIVDIEFTEIQFNCYDSEKNQLDINALDDNKFYYYYFENLNFELLDGFDDCISHLSFDVIFVD